MYSRRVGIPHLWAKRAKYFLLRRSGAFGVLCWIPASMTIRYRARLSRSGYRGVLLILSRAVEHFLWSSSMLSGVRVLKRVVLAHVLLERGSSLCLGGSGVVVCICSMCIVAKMLVFGRVAEMVMDCFRA